MNYLRDYYERALQEFGTSDDGEQSLSSPKKGKLCHYAFTLALI